jgi:hypothetical protein
MCYHLFALVVPAAILLTHLRICSLQETSAAGAERGKPPRFLNELEALYGDQNRNTLSCP